MTARCHVCGSKNLRPSRVQRKDLIYFLTLRHPARCRYCRERFYVSIFRITEVRRDALARDIRHQDEMRPPQPVFMDRHRVEDFR